MSIKVDVIYNKITILCLIGSKIHVKVTKILRIWRKKFCENWPCSLLQLVPDCLEDKVLGRSEVVAPKPDHQRRFDSPRPSTGRVNSIHLLGHS